MTESDKKNSPSIGMIAGQCLWLVFFYTILGATLFYAYQWKLTHGAFDLEGLFHGI